VNFTSRIAEQVTSCKPFRLESLSEGITKTGEGFRLPRSRRRYARADQLPQHHPAADAVATLFWPDQRDFQQRELHQHHRHFRRPRCLLRLSASSGVHAVAYDAVVITVAPLITLGISRLHSNRHLSWTGGTPPFVIEQTTNFPPAFWISILTTAIQGASFPIAPGQTYFRVRGN